MAFNRKLKRNKIKRIDDMGVIPAPVSVISPEAAA